MSHKLELKLDRITEKSSGHFNGIAKEKYSIKTSHEGLNSGFYQMKKGGIKTNTYNKDLVGGANFISFCQFRAHEYARLLFFLNFFLK